jgi:hypothetical protein
MAEGLLTICNLAAAAAQTTTPVLCGALGVGAEKFGAARPAQLHVDRDRDGASGAIQGTIGIFGAMLPHPNSGSLSTVQRFLATASQTVFDPTLADMPYAALSNNNWIVLKNGVPLAPTSGFTVTNPSTTQARITLGVAAAANDRIDIYRVTPVTILADGANPFYHDQIVCYTAMWAVTTGATSSKSQAWLSPLGD